MNTTQPLRLASAASLLCLAAAAQAAPTVVYRETFPNGFITSGSGQQGLEATAQGWYAAQHGGTPFVTQTGQIAKPAVGNTELAAVNSNPQGPNATTGFLFFSPAQRAGIYFYTGEVAALNLSTSNLLNVSWDSRNSSDNTDPRTFMRLAFLIGGNWFISSTGEAHSSGSGSAATWETNSLSPLGLSYQLFDDHNVGEPITALPRNNDNLPAVQALPVGTVQANGLWMGFNTQVATPPGGQAVNPTIRIDNFTITANVIPLPGTLALAGLTLLAMGAVRRRSPRA